MKFLLSTIVVLFLCVFFASQSFAVDLWYSGAAPVVAPANVGRGDSFTVSGFHISSNYSATYNFRVGVHAVWTEGHTVHNLLCGSRTISRLIAPGAPILVADISCTMPTSVRLGTINLVVMADDLNVIVETDEANNHWQGTFFVDGPDLQFANVPLLTPATVEPGGTLTINAFNVQNSSAEACGPSQVGLYLANTNNIWDWSFPLATIDIPGLAGGASVPVNGTVVTLPPRNPLVLGTDYIVVALDHTGLVEETNEVNNAITRPFTCVVLDRWTEIPVTLDMGSSSYPPVITSLAWGDYDHDGAPDLIAGDLHLSRGHLLHNDGSGQLTEVLPSPVGNGIGNGVWADRDNNGWPDLAGVYLNGGWGDFVYAPIQPFNSGVWADFDRDGRLDFFRSNRNQVTPAAGSLYRNLDGNAFTLAQSTTPVFGAAATWGDYDNDGWPDLYQSADVSPESGINAYSKLFHNVAGTLVDVTPPYHYGVGWGAEWGDYNNDGQLELLDYGRYGAGIGSFTGGAAIALDGISAYSCGGGSGADYDNDGDLDLALGALRINLPGQPQGLLLYMNDGTESFPPAASSPLNDHATDNVTWADIDQDGDLDLCVEDSESGLRLYRNDRVPYHRWLQLELHGTASNASAIGARVTCYAGGRTMTREVNGGFGTPDQNPFTVSFGLGTADVVDSLVIRWPSGIVQRLAPIQPVDRRLHLVEDAHSTGVDDVPGATGLRLHAAVPNPFNPSTTLRFDVPADGRVRLAVYDLAGRRVRDLVDEEMTAGAHEAIWAGLDDAGRGVPSGVYCARLESAAGAVTGLMVLVR